MRAEAYIEAERVEYDKAMREIDYLRALPDVRGLREAYRG